MRLIVSSANQVHSNDKMETISISFSLDSLFEIHISPRFFFFFFVTKPSFLFRFCLTKEKDVKKK